MVAAAMIVGLIWSRMPENICTGSVRCSAAVRNSATTTSSNEVTKAKSAPEIMPGRISGITTLKNTVCGGAPQEAPARISVLSKLDKVAVTVLRRGQSQSLTATLDDGNLRFGNARVLRDRIRTPHGPGWYPGDAPARRSGQDGPGPDGPPMERLERQMNRLQEQMDRLKEKLDKLKN